MSQTLNIVENIPHLHMDELNSLVASCEKVIRRGKATMDDYEAFVYAQRELVKRQEVLGARAA